MHEQRDKQILKSRATGLTVAQIAKLYDLSERHVWRVLASAKDDYRRQVRPRPKLAKSA